MTRTLLVGMLVTVAGVLAAGCGGDDHPNDPRPPAPIDVTARVSDDGIAVEPEKFGAGLVNMTISNQTDDPVQLAVTGPTEITGGVIQPNQPGNLKFNFEEGEYEVSAGDESDAKPTLVKVGPERASSQNELLLP